MYMTNQEALCWIDQVDGVVYYNRESGDAASAWVAVVRTPAGSGQAAQLILAFGESLEDAACAAEAQWDEIWEGLSSVH